MDITGVSIAMLITYLTLCVIINVYASRQTDIKDAWFIPNADTFKNIWPYLKLALPGTLMICLEWWTFEAMTLMAGYISVDVTAAEILLLNLCSLLFMIPQGIS
jgi:MATE family multidrug resistance protein